RASPRSGRTRRPSARAGGAVARRPPRRSRRYELRGQRLEDRAAADRAAQRVDGVLGVRHESHDVARLIGDAGDVAQRAVRVLPGRVAEDYLAAGLDAVELVVG